MEMGFTFLSGCILETNEKIADEYFLSLLGRFDRASIGATLSHNAWKLKTVDITSRNDTSLRLLL